MSPRANAAALSGYCDLIICRNFNGTKVQYCHNITIDDDVSKSAVYCDIISTMYPSPMVIFTGYIDCLDIGMFLYQAYHDEKSVLYLKITIQLLVSFLGFTFLTGLLVGCLLG